eukprot:5385974-Amphidinium_carterae.2
MTLALIPTTTTTSFGYARKTKLDGEKFETQVVNFAAVQRATQTHRTYPKGKGKGKGLKRATSLARAKKKGKKGDTKGRYGPQVQPDDRRRQSVMRVPVATVAMRVRCWRCGQVGHMANNCMQPKLFRWQSRSLGRRTSTRSTRTVAKSWTTMWSKRQREQQGLPSAGGKPRCSSDVITNESVEMGELVLSDNEQMDMELGTDLMTMIEDEAEVVEDLPISWNHQESGDASRGSSLHLQNDDLMEQHSLRQLFV